ncbi:MAG: response regulator [Crocinitomicaceae bacterium]
MRSSKEIILFEDDIVDAMTVQRALKENKITNDLVIKRNGEEGLNYLLDNLDNLPCLILLDLNMPIMNGIEFLEERLKHKKLQTIPVVVLTTSKDDQDKLSSYGLNISGYILKPVDYTQFVKIIHIIDLYFTLNESID